MILQKHCNLEGIKIERAHLLLSWTVQDRKDQGKESPVLLGQGQAPDQG